MGKKWVGLLPWLALILPLCLAASTQTDKYRLQVVVGSGGGLTKTNNYNLQLVSGQPVVGLTNSSDFNAWLGFFYGRYYLLNFPPYTPTLLLPPSGSRQIWNSVTLNYTTTDPNGDIIYYYVFGDSNSEPSTQLYTGTNRYYVWSTSDGVTYFWRVRAFDGKEWSAYSAIWNFTENTQPTHNSPVILPENPSSNQNITCTPQNGADAENDNIEYVFNWRVNGESIMVLNMPFEYNTSIRNRRVKDYSGSGNNGTVHGAVWTTQGLQGGAYVFDGQKDYINISHHNSLSFAFGKPFSIVLWFKTSEPEDTSQFILAKGAGVTSYNYKIELASSGIQFIISNSTAQQSVSNGFTPSKNVWYMVAMIYNGSHLNAYVNGSYIGTKIINGVITNSNPILIGRYMGAGDYFFNGTIDDVRIYSKALKDSQIFQIYSETLEKRGNSTIVSHETKKGETWLCEVTPVDGYEDGLKKTDSVLIENSPPPKVTLISPPNSSTTYNRTITFNWSAVEDPDGDSVNYSILIAKDAGFTNIAYNISNIIATNFTPSALLAVDTTYWWKVRAYDGLLFGNYSDPWNITIESLKSINITVDKVIFGELQPSMANDTTDDNPPPLRVENIGNMHVNLSISANQSLFVNANLGEKYFQFKADEYDVGCYIASQSATSWRNFTASPQRIIGGLDFNRSRNEAEIEVRVEVPYKEPPSKMSAKVTVEIE